MSRFSFSAEAHEAIQTYVARKNPYLYGVVLLFFAAVFVQITQYAPNQPVGLLLMPMSMLYFGLHELAHAFTMSLPEIVTAASGSFSEIIFGALLVFAAVRSRYYFAALYCVLWLVFALKDTGIYMADARNQELILFSPFGDNAIHDWNFVFEKLGLLRFDQVIGNTFILVGYLCGMLSLVIGVWLIRKMMNYAGEAEKVERATQLAQKLRASQGFESPESVAVTKGPLMDRQRNIQVPPRQSGATAHDSNTSIYPEASRGVLSYDAADEYPSKNNKTKKNKDHE